MGLLSWVGQVIGLSNGRFWGQYFSGPTWAGRPVNEGNSLQLATWWRAVALYADVVGPLPLKFYQRTANDERQLARDHRVADLIGSNPNQDQTPQEYWGGVAAGMAIFGNAYSEKQFVGPNVVALEPMPRNTAPTRLHSSDGSLEYHVNDRGRDEWLPAEKVFHVRGFTDNSRENRDIGLSPLAAARQTLSIALATEEAVGRTFAQGLRASGFFTGQGMNAEQRDSFKAVYIDPITGNDASAHYGILPPGFDFKTINIPPKDAEMLLSRKFGVEEIARFMRTPPILLGHAAEGQTMWGTGVEAIINQWLILGLNAFLTAIEQSINKRLLKPEERSTFYAEFERNALLRIDTTARAEFVSKMIQFAQLTPNEGRKIENRPPKTGGDILLVNATMVPLTEAGKLSRGLPAPDQKFSPAPGKPPASPSPDKPGTAP